MSVGCTTNDGRPRMFVFGGWGMTPCGGPRPCLMHKDELVALDLNAMLWHHVETNAEQPKPPARKGHTASLVNGSHMFIFGGSACVATAKPPDGSRSARHGPRR